MENESDKLDYMGRILAICKGADEDWNGCPVSEALGSDSARRRRGRENDQHGAALEALGDVSTGGRRGYGGALAIGSRGRETGEGAGLSHFTNFSIYFKRVELF